MNATETETPPAPPTSKIFPLRPFATSKGQEYILQGGRILFNLLPQAFEGIRQVAVIGFKSQGRAQSQNVRDTFEDAGVSAIVKVGLRAGSPTFAEARALGFSACCDPGDGTVCELQDIIPNSDIVALLIEDAALTKHWEEYIGLMKPGATLLLSHGFLIGHLHSIGKSLRADINVVLVAPKGMGNSVRLLYLQGKETSGAGINASVAVFQDVNGRALDIALGWSVAIGSPVTFFTTMENEVKSDVSGERGPLLALIKALVEAWYRYLVRNGVTPQNAFLWSTKGLTSTVSQLFSDKGLLGAYNQLPEESQAAFRCGYMQAYGPARKIIEQIYENVSSWKEIAEVVADIGKPMESLETSEMWQVGKELYETKVPMVPQLAHIMGAYAAGIMAQMNVLIANGHCVSEVVNESFIEAIDSLNPFMDKKGVGFMVDNCSITARRGTRKWCKPFEDAFVAAFSGTPEQTDDFEAFLESPLHGDIEACFAFRPSVRIVLN